MQHTLIEQELIDRTQAARMLGISTRTLARLVSIGTVQAVRPFGSRTVRFNRRQLQQWIDRGCPEPGRHK